MPMIQLVSYGFTTVENPLSDGGNFTAVADTIFTGALQVPSNGICEPAAITTNEASFYSAVIPAPGGLWPDDQYSEITLLTQTGGFASIIVRIAGAATGRKTY